MRAGWVRWAVVTGATLVAAAAQANGPPIAHDQTVHTVRDTPTRITLTGSDPDNDPLTWLVTTSPVQGRLMHVSDAVGEHVDASWFAAQLIADADLWNGGTGNPPSTGLGTYQTGWDGLFRAYLNRRFEPVPPVNDSMTLISQSRGIVMNAAGYHAAAAPDRDRFREAVQKAADYLLQHAPDPLYGGMFYRLEADGTAPPQDTTKSVYGHAHALLALAHAYRVTGDADHLAGARSAWNTLNVHFGDPRPGDPPGSPRAFGVDKDRTLTDELTGERRNSNYMLHVFEALLVLYDVSTAAERAPLADQISRVGDFMAHTMYQDEPGSSPARGYIPHFYQADWSPVTAPSSRDGAFVNTGHAVEIAVLLSHAVARGFGDASWIERGNRLINFVLEHAWDAVSGSLARRFVAYDGAPFQPLDAEVVTWWPQAEMARALLHYGAYHRDDLWDEFDATMQLIRNHQIDPVYSGWFWELGIGDLSPTRFQKGSIWKVNYHVSTFYAEALHLVRDLDARGPEVTYVPRAGFVGTDSFTVKANDGLLDSNPATVSIIVDESGFAAEDLTINEEAETARVRVVLQPARNHTTSVGYATQSDSAVAGEDFLPTSGTLIFAGGETSKVIPVTILDDLNPESPERFLVNLSDPANAAIIDGQSIVTIQDGSGALGDFVWDDANGDGLQDAHENGMAKVVVVLRDCAGNDLVATTSNSKGRFRFDGLAAGRYQIAFVAPAGFRFSPPLQGTKRGRDSNPDAATGITSCIAVKPGQSKLGIDAGLMADAGTGRIGDRVWRDLDGDGIQDASEPGFPDVGVVLLDCDGFVKGTTATDAVGLYAFGHLAAGRYGVEFTPPPGFRLSPRRQGDKRGKDSDPFPATGRTACIPLLDGQAKNGIDAGITE